MIITRSRTLRRHLALPLGSAILLLSASGAAAQPIGSGDPPIPPNSAPIAKLKVTPKIALVNTLFQVQAKVKDLGQLEIPGTGDNVKFDASASTDADGDTLHFDWDLDGNGAYEIIDGDADQQKRYYATGTFHTKVRVRDGAAIDTQAQDVIVHARPNAQLKADLTTPLVGQTVAYDAATSTADPSIASVVWDLDGDGTFETNSGTALTATSSYGTPGPRTVKVKITDTYGVTDTASVVEKVNQLPTAAFINGAAVAGQPVSFLGSVSSDDSAITNYSWDLDGDGTFETDGGASPSTSKSYPTAGPRTVRLRVTDDLGATAIVARVIEIAPAPVPTATPAPTPAPKGDPGSGTQTGVGGTTLSDKTAPFLKLATKKFKLSKTGKIAIRLTCPTGEVSCKGTVKIRIGSKRPKTIATAKFTIVGGQAKSVSLTVPAAQRRSIRRGSKLSAKAIIAVADAAGNKGASTTGILIGL